MECIAEKSGTSKRTFIFKLIGTQPKYEYQTYKFN